MCVGNRNNSHSLCVGNRFNVHSLCLGTGFNIHSLCRGNRFNVHSLCIGNRFNIHSLPFHGEILSCNAHASISTADHDDDREDGTNKGLCRDLDEADLGRLLSRLMIDGDCRRHIVVQIPMQPHTAGASAHTAISGMKAHSRFLLPGFRAHLAVHATAITWRSVLRHIR